MPKTAAKGTSFTLSETVVGSLKSIGGVEVTADTIDVTSIDNADGYREFIGGFKDGGEVPLEGYFDYSNAGQKALYEAFESGDVCECAINFPAKMGCKWAFDGVVTAFKTGADLEDAISFSCTVKVSGKPTLSAVAGS